MRKIPNAIYWFFTADTLRDKNYLKAVDYVKENTEFDHMCLTMQGGVIREDYHRTSGKRTGACTGTGACFRRPRQGTF